MKQVVLVLCVAAFFATSACEKTGDKPGEFGTGPRTNVPAALKGTWMYGKFSMTEYWSVDPSTYLGNGLEFAIAFTFHPDGTYTHYFTSRSVMAGFSTYNQSVTKGTVEIDEQNQTIKMHAATSHYKRTKNGRVEEDRDMRKEEVHGTTSYTYTTGKESSGTNALYLKLQGTATPLTFFQQ
ncbi:hypothetical protein EXU57_06855 [Segetibacter sp. 3557_3]|uniref:hypothetical protein n=1 Tax=Segetibacter sp. 3557_3 TaxID=2547429 RepID=UPI0010584064|nr:hypothetical protein [Segetibacter sp. 3557_3]TDH27303.1 hypothetical protein EXU57_06855 [Segetibacter sp. 3557_3]